MRLSPAPSEAPKDTGSPERSSGTEPGTALDSLALRFERSLRQRQQPPRTPQRESAAPTPRSHKRAPSEEEAARLPAEALALLALPTWSPPAMPRPIPTEAPPAANEGPALLRPPAPAEPARPGPSAAPLPEPARPMLPDAPSSADAKQWQLELNPQPLHSGWLLQAERQALAAGGGSAWTLQLAAPALAHTAGQEQRLLLQQQGQALSERLRRKGLQLEGLSLQGRAPGQADEDNSAEEDAHGHD
ncbi:MAG: hypothetical protein O9341_01530 [Paucibacter sp.]|nr:hypothetical protein [Roseateles sp.]